MDLLSVVRQVSSLDHAMARATESAQLSLRLADVYRRAQVAREAIRLEQERRKQEQAGEFRAMLMGLNQPSPETVDALRRAGTMLRKGGKPDPKVLSPDELQARRDLKEAKASAKAEEAARIRRENAAMRARIKKTGAATDNSVNDDATGLARRKAAAEAREMREAANRRIGRMNAAHKQRIGEAGVAADNITGDPSGAARRQNKQRKAGELAEENEFFSKLHDMHAAADKSASDNALGAAPQQVALDTLACSDAAAQRLLTQNHFMMQRVEVTAAATNNAMRGSILEWGCKDAAMAAKAYKFEHQRKITVEDELLSQKIGPYALGMQTDSVARKIGSAPPSTGKMPAGKKGGGKGGKNGKSPKGSPKAEKIYIIEAPTDAPTMLKRRETRQRLLETGEAELPAFRPELALKRSTSKVAIENELKMEVYMERLRQQAMHEHQSAERDEEDWAW